MALHAVIDTNVFLAFYAYTKDDVEQLRIVSELIKSGKLVLYLPEQVVVNFTVIGRSSWRSQSKLSAAAYRLQVCLDI